MEAGDEALLDRIDAANEDDRYRRGCCLGCRAAGVAADCDDHPHLASNQIGGE